MFFECSLYGSVFEISDTFKRELHYRAFKREEYIYISDNNEINYLYHQKDKITLTKYFNLDKNKQRTCLIRNIERYETKDNLDVIQSFLLSNNFKLVSHICYDLVEFVINGYFVEFTKEDCRLNMDTANIQEKEYIKNKEPEEWLVKAFCFTKNPQEGETILKTTYEDLCIKFSFDKSIFV